MFVEIILAGAGAFPFKADAVSMTASAINAIKHFSIAWGVRLIVYFAETRLGNYCYMIGIRIISKLHFLVKNIHFLWP